MIALPKEQKSEVYVSAYKMEKKVKTYLLIYRNKMV